MRLAIPAVSALVLLASASTDAPAQRLDRILGPVTGTVDSLLRRGARKILRPPVYRSPYRSRARAARSRAVSRGTAAQAAPSQLVPHSTAPTARGQLRPPEPFWPDAPQDIFSYVLAPEDARMRAPGYGALMVSMLAQPSSGPERRGRSVAAANDEQAVGAMPAAAGLALACRDSGVTRAETIVNRLGDTLALRDGERVLAELRSALRQTEEEMSASCPYSMPASFPERLRILQDRLWAIRVAASGLRAPLQIMHDALTDEQKAEPTAGQPVQRETTGESASDVSKQCYMQLQMAPQWPAEQIARAVRLNTDQQASFGVLSETTSQMDRLMMGACPQTPRTTPLARLDAMLDWLDTLLFAGTNTIIAADDFYRSLSDEQKARLDTFNL